MAVMCGVCGYDFDGEPFSWDRYQYGPMNRHATPTGGHHPIHTDAELAETKLAVDLASKVLTVDVLLWMAREAAVA